MFYEHNDMPVVFGDSERWVLFQCGENIPHHPLSVGESAQDAIEAYRSCYAQEMREDGAAIEQIDAQLARIDGRLSAGELFIAPCFLRFAVIDHFDAPKPTPLEILELDAEDGGPDFDIEEGMIPITLRKTLLLFGGGDDPVHDVPLAIGDSETQAWAAHARMLSLRCESDGLTPEEIAEELEHERFLLGTDLLHLVEGAIRVWIKAQPR